MVIRLIQATIITSFLLAFATIKLKADTQSELQMQVDVALALQRLNTPLIPTPPAPPKAEQEQETDNKVTIYVTKAPFKCAPCDQCVKDTKDKEFEDFKFDHKSPAKFQPESYPHLCWQDQSGKWYHVYGWSNVATFRRTYTEKMGQAPKTQTFPKMTGYKQQVRVRGDIASHIINDHGYNMPAGLTLDQMEALHDKLHGKLVTPTD